MLTFGGKAGIIIAICVLGLTGCNESGASKSDEKKPSAVSSGLKYCRNLTLDTETRNAEILSIVGRDTLRKSFTFTKPVERLVALSSAQVGYLLRLGAADRIVAVGEGRYISDSALYARVASGEIAEVGYGNAMDFEKLVALRPDYVMTFATGGGQDDYERLGALNLDAMLTSEWQEESPLAKAEWIKLYGMMLDDGRNGMMARADSIFEAEVAGYLEVAGKSRPDSCPRVLVGMSYGGVWYAPGGESYTARLIKDAGGCYLWASDTSRELKLTLEDVMAVADSADVWVNPGMYGSADDLKAADPRVAEFRPFKSMRVCQNDGRKGAGGGNDFFESAVIYPAELLGNLRRCLLGSNGVIKPDSASAAFEWYHNIF